jgi:hypothetical protein
MGNPNHISVYVQRPHHISIEARPRCILLEITLFAMFCTLGSSIGKEVCMTLDVNEDILNIKI